MLSRHTYRSVIIPFDFLKLFPYVLFAFFPLGEHVRSLCHFLLFHFPFSGFILSRSRLLLLPYYLLFIIFIFGRRFRVVSLFFLKKIHYKHVFNIHL